MEKAAEERKKRLAGLKRQAEESDETLRFRSYQPTTDALKEYEAEQPLIGELANKQEVTAESVTQKIQQESHIEQTFDLEKLQKKPTWDLKRGIEAKLRVLQKKTDIAIADLIRVRLKSDKDLSQIVHL